MDQAIKTWSKLPKKDKKHLRENGIYTKHQFEKQVEFMKQIAKKEGTIRSTCDECRHIAHKLGMWKPGA